MTAEALEIWLVDRMTERLGATRVVQGDGRLVFSFSRDDFPELADEAARRAAYDAADPVFGKVLGVVDIDALEAEYPTPAALVAPLPDDAGFPVAPEIERSPQRYRLELGVVLEVSAPNDRTGARSRERLSGVLVASRTALAGWKPPGMREALAWRRGALAEIDGAGIAWMDRYEVEHWASAGTIDTGG